MSKDVLFVDDDYEIVEIISELIDTCGYNPTTFTDFYKALDYVVERRGNLYACFVDMKPLGVVPDEDALTKEQREILDLPERIFEGIKKRELQERFYFISANRSEHDDEVLARTGAKFINKTSLVYIIKKILS